VSRQQNEGKEGGDMLLATPVITRFNSFSELTWNLDDREIADEIVG
jgi:hypothetical protein